MDYAAILRNTPQECFIHPVQYEKQEFLLNLQEKLEDAGFETDLLYPVITKYQEGFSLLDEGKVEKASVVLKGVGLLFMEETGKKLGLDQALIEAAMAHLGEMFIISVDIEEVKEKFFDVKLKHGLATTRFWYDVNENLVVDTQMLLPDAASAATREQYLRDLDGSARVIMNEAFELAREGDLISAGKAMTQAMEVVDGEELPNKIEVEFLESGSTVLKMVLTSDYMLSPHLFGYYYPDEDVVFHI